VIDVKLLQAALIFRHPIFNIAEYRNLSQKDILVAMQGFSALVENTVK